MIKSASLVLLALALPSTAMATDYHLIRVMTGGGQQKALENPAAPQVTNAGSVSSDATETWVHLDVQLPQGATITGLTGYGEDNLDPKSINIALNRSAYWQEALENIGNVSSTNNTNAWTANGLNSQVNNQDYAYWVSVQIPRVLLGQNPDELRIWTVEIAYTP